ncbi:MAG: protein kinase, partial [Kamptonema sp. SIO4C4]|nr:protein kinase [Kamptonema sp. SIO4C4]
MSRATPRFQVGQTIFDRYTINRLLGEGNLGKTYQIHHRGWQLDLALKTPNPLVVERVGGIDPFEQAIRCWQNLGLHPHLASAYYVRSWQGHPLLFSEYGSGGSLQRWIQQGKLYQGGTTAALKRILDIAIQMAWCLQDAHSKGVIHQNLKPSNILLTVQGIAKITDFGGTKLRTQDNDRSLPYLTPWGCIAPPYAAPELIQEAGTPESDAWAWALVLLEMFQGTRTWQQGPRAREALTQYLRQPPNPQRFPPMPQGVIDLLWSCFEEHPQQRPWELRYCAEHLRQLYWQLFGTDYPRQAPNLGAHHADALNNRAVALLDLGRKEEAIALWEEARSIQPNHPESTYNWGLLLWRSHQVTDDLLLRELEKSLDPKYSLTPYFLGLIHLERDDCESAIALFEQLPQDHDQSPLLHTAQQVAHNRLPSSKCRYLDHPGKQTAKVGKAKVVQVVCFSPDGRYTVSGKADGTLELWDFQTGQSHIFAGHQDQTIQTVAITPDNRYVISIGAIDRGNTTVLTLKLWSLITGKCLSTFPITEGRFTAQTLAQAQDDLSQFLTTPHPEPTHSSQAAPPRLAQRSEDGRYLLCKNTVTLTLQELATGQTLYTCWQDGSPLWIIPKGHYGLTGGKTPHLWNLANGQLLRRFSPQSPITAIALLPNGRYFLSAHQDGRLKLWSLATGRCLHSFESHQRYLNAIALSFDGRYALTAGQGLKFWSLESGRCLRTLSEDDSLEAIALSPDGRFALAGGQQGLHLWQVNCYTAPYLAPYYLCQVQPSINLLSVQEMYEQELSQAQKALDTAQFLDALRSLKRARSLIGDRFEVRGLSLWQQLYTRLPRVTIRDIWEMLHYSEHHAPINGVALSADNQWVLSGGQDHRLHLWNIETADLLQKFGHRWQENVTALALSPRGRSILAGGAGGTLQLWDGTTGRLLYQFEQGGPAVTAVSFSPDSCYLVAGHESGIIKLWEVATGRYLRAFTEHQTQVRSVGFSPDGCFLLSCEAGSDPQQTPPRSANWKYWDVATGDCLQTVTFTDPLTVASLSPDGYYGVSASTDGTLSLWAVRVGRCLRLLRGHEQTVTAVAFSSDSRYLFSGSEDGHLKLWNAITGECLRTLAAHGAGITSIALSRDGRYAVTGSRDGQCKVWGLDWELAEQPQADWDEGARPYLETFLMLHTPYAATLPYDLRPKRPGEERHYPVPVRFFVLLLVLAWAGMAVASEIFTEAHLNSALLALGMAGFVSGYFFGRQAGNPTVQLGALFGTAVLAIVATVNAPDNWSAPVSVGLGAVVALLLTGAVLGITEATPTARLPGMQSCRQLKERYGVALTAAMLLGTVLLGMGIELLLTQGGFLWEWIGLGTQGRAIAVIVLASVGWVGWAIRDRLTQLKTPKRFFRQLFQKRPASPATSRSSSPLSGHR